MGKVSVKSEFGKEIKDILDSTTYQDMPFIDRGFVCIDVIPHDAILFIGLNPSYPKGSLPSDIDFYSLKEQKNEYKPYFGKLEKIGQSDWSHMDMLYVRETSQKAVIDILNQKVGLEFICKQLEVSKKILEAAKPKLLVVCNTQAATFLGKNKSNNKQVWMGYDFKFDEVIGTHRITNEDSSLNNIPVFFTSMLSGQRALDNGSFERLKWHIKFALNNGIVDSNKQLEKL